MEGAGTPREVVLPMNAHRLRRSRGLRRGVVVAEELLSVAAILGCFVVPIAIAARTVGARLVGEIDRTHETLVKQPGESP